MAFVVPEPLTEVSLAAAVDELAARDPDLAGIVGRFGPPPLWGRQPGFPSLVRIVLEQQVSLASAQAAYERLCTAVDPLEPAGFLELDDRRLLAIGFSRQKAGYVRDLARALVTGAVRLEALAALPDDEAFAALRAIRGVGPWSAQVYLLTALLRPDVWPSTDVALATAVREAKGLVARPGPEAMEDLAASWRPWRSVAARLFWHDYLRRRGRPG